MGIIQRCIYFVLFIPLFVLLMPIGAVAAATIALAGFRASIEHPGMARAAFWNCVTGVIVYILSYPIRRRIPRLEAAMVCLNHRLQAAAHRRTKVADKR